jgi:hypothetical protein
LFEIALQEEEVVVVEPVVEMKEPEEDSLGLEEARD